MESRKNLRLSVIVETRLMYAINEWFWSLTSSLYEKNDKKSSMADLGRYSKNPQAAFLPILKKKTAKNQVFAGVVAQKPALQPNHA